MKKNKDISLFFIDLTRYKYIIKLYKQDISCFVASNGYVTGLHSHYWYLLRGVPCRTGPEFYTAFFMYMELQSSLFDEEFPEYSINRKIRLIELFAGYGSQSLAMKRIGADFESYKAVEFDTHACNLYNKVHNTDFPVLDITKIHGSDLEIVDKDKYEYILFYSFPCTDLSVAGQQKGMSRDSGTRSGLLWEVERLMKELDADNHNLPHIGRILIVNTWAFLRIEIVLLWFQS